MARVASRSVSELVQFRIVLEISACQLAAAQHTDEQLDRMRDAIDRMEAEVDSGGPGRRHRQFLYMPVPQVTSWSAMPSTSSSIPRPSAASAALMLHGGTT